MPENIRRSPMTPTKLSQQDYASAVASHLKTFEGAVARIYTDDYGIPTMGSGVALAVRGANNRVSLRDLNAIGGEVSGDPAKPYRFTAAEAKLLNDTVDKLNDPNLNDPDRVTAAQKLIPPFVAGAESADKNKFGFSLSDERVAKQAEGAWAEHRDRAFATVRQQATARGWSKEQTDSYIDTLKGSQQEIALTSMAFNGVPAPKATGAMLDNDPATMRKEILYNSNADRSNGIAARRRAEADLATGSPSGWSDADQKTWQGVETSTAAKAYRKAYPNAFRDKTSALTPEEAEAQGMPPGEYLVARQRERDAQTQERSGGPQMVAARDPTVMTDASPDTGPAPLDPPAPIGGLGNEAIETAKAMEPGEQTANTDARIAAMRERAAAPIDDPARSALLKPVGSWTEGEMKDVLNAAQTDFRGWRSGDPLKDHMVERVQDWHTHVYGEGPQRLDGGKPVATPPIIALPTTPAPHTTPQGIDLWKVSARLGEKLAAAAESDGYDTTVKGLQRGINMVTSTLPLPDRSPAWGAYTRQPPLVEDGDYGPRTDFALKDMLSRHGAAKADDALALGRFDLFADNARAKGSAEGLDRATRSIFGPLYNSSDAPAGVLQSTLNAVGRDAIDGWEPLKEDRWIGPKTTDAFARVVDAVDPSDLTRRFGRDLGLL